MYIIHCTLYTDKYTLHTVQCTLHTVQSPQESVHSVQCKVAASTVLSVECKPAVQPVDFLLGIPRPRLSIYKPALTGGEYIHFWFDLLRNNPDSGKFPVFRYLS